MIYFDKGQNKQILKAVHETHPFCMFSPNIIRAGKTLDACSWMLLMEIGLRLKYDSGSFMLKLNTDLQKKLNRDADELTVSLGKLINEEIISIVDKEKNIYQINPEIMWKGSMETLLEKNQQLFELCTFTMKPEYKNADDLTAKRVIDEILKKQKELSCQNIDDEISNDRNIIDLPGEKWIPLNGHEAMYEISNKGRVKIVSSKQVKLRIIEKGLLKITGIYYPMKKLVSEHFPETRDTRFDKF